MEADRILSEAGWLSHMIPEFRATVLRHAILMRFVDELVFRYGDPIGGIYGLVAGTGAMNLAPLDETPRLIHLSGPGIWTGEECFISRQHRRGELRALGELWLMHLPLDAMDRIASLNPEAIRAFANISISSMETLVRVIYDLQKPQADRRIAAVLQRTTSVGQRHIPLSQADIGIMANASRQQVNAVLQRFVAAGWIEHQYRAITVKDAGALYNFAAGDGSD
ncbi:Crp/Fnr family transcriptional regulator [Roseiarcaceae bacterium H3SJ34-1]|uniref:Crp/Fnr family transcriptional regulator n=1 Tax=Terripilifer ovatus TaxID=3032367 RepID=UPI003AB957A4|nr:Crp/Fnr family transcriptional regulator [Roseiarcaceae bacterium H3SJ34-1]